MENRNKHLYPMLMVAAFSVTAFSLVGVATMTGTIPGAHSEVLDATPPVVPRPVSTDGTAARFANAVANQAAKASPASCASCGVVESVRVVERQGSGTGLGAVAGGVAGAVVGSQIGGGNGRNAMAVLGGVGGALAGNEIEKNVKKSTAWQIHVRLDDGTLRVTTQANPPGFAVGDKVRVEGGSVVRRG